MQAIYVRQSVDKKDSISIETQIEECKSKISITEDYEIFKDKGFSGKSTDRPEFQRMMSEVKRGNVTKIVVYKYDRISRSLYDFINMQKEFERYNTALISVNENFDTSTTQGKAMVNILMTFAEMERETIQQRIKDNYYSRGEKGLYLGGYAPFGYTKTETSVNGKKTYTFKENKYESEILRQMYNDYLNGKSLGELSRELNDNKIPTRKNRPWSTTCIARMLRNPVYVKADADVYNYLVSLGGHMNNSIEEYIGENGCYVYGEVSKRKGNKFVSLENDFVSLGLHKGIIDADLWLSVQQIFSRKKGHSNLGTGSLTWLQGLVRCKCGYTYYAKRFMPNKSKKEYKYLYCRGRKNNACPYPKVMMNVDRIEAIVEEALFERLEDLKNIRMSGIVKYSPEINSLKIRLAETDKKISNLMVTLSEGTEVTAEYVNRYIKELDTEKRVLTEQIAELELKSSRLNDPSLDIDNILNNWHSYDIELKKKIAKDVIDVIILEGSNISINFF